MKSYIKLFKRIKGVHDEGFTLIELLVTMAVVAVLVLLSVPSFIGYIKNAKVTAMKQDTKVLSDVADIYYVENGEWPSENDVTSLVDNALLEDLGSDIIVESLNEEQVNQHIKSLRNDITSYGIITSNGEYRGEVIHLNGLEDKNNNKNYWYKSSIEANSNNEPDNSVVYIDELELKLSEHGIIHFNTDTEMVEFKRNRDTADEQDIKRYEALQKHIHVNVGSSELLAGTKQQGYYGLVKASDLYTGEEISVATGLSDSGKLIQENINMPWLKFAYNGKTLYKSKQPYMNSITMDAIDAKNARIGNKSITKDNQSYRVRLMKGSHVDEKKLPENWNAALFKESEWNKLMLPIYKNADPNVNWNYPEYIGSTDNEYWNINFTRDELGVGNNIAQWGQEKYILNNSTYSYGLLHGNYAEYGSFMLSLNGGSNFVWSPVLELIE